MWQAKEVIWNQLIPYDREPLEIFKLHFNLKCSSKPIFLDKDLKQIRNKLTNDKVDCVLEKGNSN